MSGLREFKSWLVSLRVAYFLPSGRLPLSVPLIWWVTSPMGRSGCKEDRRKGNVWFRRKENGRFRRKENGWFRTNPNLSMNQLLKVFVLPPVTFIFKGWVFEEEIGPMEESV